MRPGDRNGIAVIISVILASITVLPLTSDRSFLPISWISIIMIGAVSIALRRARMSSTSVLGVQVVVMVVCSVGLSLSMPTPAGTSDLPWFQRYPALWADGIEHMRSQASPMDPNDGVTLIFVTTICLIMIMTDLLVSGVHRPAWSIAPPATLFLVPALGLGTDTGVFNFLLIAAGFLTILVAGGLNTTARWTRGLSRDSAEGFGAATPVVWRAAGFLAVPAVLVTIVLGDRTADPGAAGIRLRQRAGRERSVAADRPDPGPPPEPQPARRPHRDRVPDRCSPAGSICGWLRCLSCRRRAGATCRSG